MYELSRVRLFSVGPPGARYQDVCLDLRGIGPAVRAAPTQMDFFAADDVERVPRRPSPASVLFLENGGGKSVLLKLVFSVILPGRRQVVGTTSTTVLEKFVLGDDVAHVACEWMHTATGQLLVTGKVSEWRGHTASSDPDKLTDAWYSFTPAPRTDERAGFGLDDLPFTRERRRLTLSAFRDRLTEADAEDPTRSLVWESGHADWTRHLVDIGLDPELFRYQRAMNAGEGEAADAFTFPTDEAFVDFLLRAVLDPEEPRTLAELVAGYATRIAERADLELEREFVAGVLDLLGPLGEAERAARLARAGEESARRTARALAAAVVARRGQEEERLAAVGEALAQASDAAQLATGEERRLREVDAELRRRVAALRLRDATAARDAVQGEKDAAERLVDAWRAVEPVLADRLAGAEARRLREVVDAEQERARPALRARQAAAAALAASLAAGAAAAEETARSAAAAVATANAAAGAAREEELRQVREAAGHRAAVDQAHTALGRIRDRVAAAVADGLLHADEAAVERVAEAADRAGETLAAGTAELTGLHAELDRLRRDRRSADVQLGTARAAESAAAAAATRAEDEWSRADERRRELTGEQRLADLLGLETVEPDTDAGGALELVAAAVGAGERERTGLLAEQDRDARALRALGEGGLLPPVPDVEQALAVLEAAGVRAWAGWRYLAMLPAGAREDALHRFPHLVGGVLLNDPADVDRARDALGAARGLPSAVVAVGTTAALDAAAADPGSGAPAVEFVVPPNPALVDEDAAAQVRAQLGAETADRDGRLTALDEQVRTDRGLADRLRDWATRYPPGALDALDATRSRAASAAVRARAAVEAAAADIAALDDRADQLERSRPRLDEAVATARDRAARLDALRTVAAEQADLREQVRTAGEAVTEAEYRAAAARASAERAHADATEAQRTEDRQTAAARNRREELAELPLDGEVPAAGADDQPLEVLRTEFRRAAAAYAAAEINPDLRSELAGAERTAESAREAVDRLDVAVRREADALLRTPDGAAESARHSAFTQAQRVLAGLTTRLQNAVTEVKVAELALAELPAQQRSIEPYGEPTDAEHGRELLDRVGRDLHSAAAVAAQAQARRASAEAEQRASAAAAERFADLVRTLDDAPTEVTDVAPFAGDATAASQRWAQTQAAVREAAQGRARAEGETRRGADGVAKLAQDPRFDTVTSPVRRHILKIDRSETPAMAAEWELALRPRLRSLDDDLANIGRYRSGIVTRLQGMVGEALRTLRLAGRLSQLPEGLSDWSGQQFLRIRFDDVADAELTARLGEVVDRTAAEHTGKGGGSARERRDGMGLLLRGVRAAMPKGVRVEMLKPDAVLRTERLRVSEIRDVFSGGQQLTAAIVLYCTMAALRANQRGQGRRQHAGVLFLDNPIGRASAGYLLELQFGVAQALGVQLIYTTGLFDAGALSAFPLIIRLRNDADLRAGRKYLSVDEHIRREIDQLAPEDGSGRIAAARVYRRPEKVDPARVEAAPAVPSSP